MSYPSIASMPAVLSGRSGSFVSFLCASHTAGQLSSDVGFAVSRRVRTTPLAAGDVSRETRSGR
ncbi:hypothetical protein LK10_05410 [Sinomonas humi]|uniref:Uncharacterized protein n=1 Tax=Sinomonas humi TaxID=1338436 RepID=A0A0B2AR86_9MICC|nr:hypothetical protein LK10_05410 [Sinomonas humi]